MAIDLHKIIQNPLTLGSGLLLLAAALLMLWSLGTLVGAFLYAPEASLYSKQENTLSSPFNPDEISSRNFFGLAEAQPELVVENLPETKLALILRGAFMGEDANGAGAIIENEDTNIADNYYIGESLPGDATLKAIYADRVVLSRNGLLETLYFPDISDSTGIGEVKRDSGGASSYTPVEDPAAEARREAIRERIRQLREKRNR